MFESIKRIFLFIYYFFYNLFKGKEEWKCDNNDVEIKKPTKACCTPVLNNENENNHRHQQLSLKENNTTTTNNFYSSTPRPYVDPTKKSWWQWTKDICYNGWQKVKSTFSYPNTRGEATIVKWLKFIPIQLWRGFKWILHGLLGILVWILEAFMKIFRGKEASKSDETTIPKQYVYKKIESPRDYLNYDNFTSDQNENLEDEEAKVEEESFENDATDDNDEITLIQKPEPEHAIISPAPQVVAFSHGERFKEQQESRDATTTNNHESPISFYARRVSVASSTKSGAGENGTTTTATRYTSPPPPAPPPPKSAIRIPTTNTENTNSKEQSTTNEKAAVEGSTIKGGVSVMVPGLMDAAQESMERRKRGRTLSPEKKNAINSNNNSIGGIWAPYRSPSVLGTSTTTPTSATIKTTSKTTNRTTTTNNNQGGSGVVTRMNAQTPTSEAFLFRPRSQTARNIETIDNQKDYFHPDNSHYQQQKRMFSTSPTPSFLLGQSVFKPVTEVEKIRDNFNRKTESRAASVVGGGGYSRSPSVMSQSYHESGRNRDNDNYTPYRDSGYESSALRHRYPMHYASGASNNDYSTTSYGQTPNQKWTIRNNGKDDDVFSRLPIGGTRRVLERKVTEKHLEKDVDGQVLNGWREQNWMGTYEQFENPNRIL